MKNKMNILNSEKDFRDYLSSNYQNISQIIIFEDILDHAIFFYCFEHDNSIVSTKEVLYKNFYLYKNIYEQLAQEINFSISNYKNLNNTLRLISNEIN